jgi:hypothetical protein
MLSALWRDLLEVTWKIGKRLLIEEGNQIRRSWIQLHRVEQVRRRQLIRRERE